MKKKISLILFCFISLTVMAQKDASKKYSFQSFNSIGLMIGDATSPVLQTVNGLKKGPWFAGIGLGLDYYRYRTVPLFADIRYDFRKKNRTSYFVYGDGGINFHWVEDYFYDEPSIWSSQTNEFKNGVYADLGIGIHAGFKNGNAFVLSLGYSGKTMQELVHHDDWRTGNRLTDVNKYKFNRIAIKVGFKFG